MGLFIFILNLDTEGWSNIFRFFFMLYKFGIFVLNVLEES